MHHPTDRITHTTAFVTPSYMSELRKELEIYERRNPRRVAHAVVAAAGFLSCYLSDPLSMFDTYVQ